MASQFDVHTVAVNYGAFTGATAIPLIYLSEDGGAITILDAKVIGQAAGTSVTLGLYTYSSQGTPAVNGTIGVFAGTVVYAAGVAFDCTISDATVDPGTTGIWIGLDQASGTASTNSILVLDYIMGGG